MNLSPWDRNYPLYGTVIGHKRIVVLDCVRTTALRIRILDARVAPTVKFIGAYA